MQHLINTLLKNLDKRNCFDFREEYDQSQNKLLKDKMFCLFFEQHESNTLAIYLFIYFHRFNFRSLIVTKIEKDIYVESYLSSRTHEQKISSKNSL